MLYELKQSARQRASLLGIALKEVGLKPLYSDSSVRVRNPGTAKMVIVAMYLCRRTSLLPDRIWMK